MAAQGHLRKMIDPLTMSAVKTTSEVSEWKADIAQIRHIQF
jgi:hypothetical protein